MKKKSVEIIVPPFGRIFVWTNLFGILLFFPCIVTRGDEICPPPPSVAVRVE